MRILVTGSNGLLGQKLTALLQQDKSVHLIATAKATSVLPITNGEYHHMNINDSKEVNDIVSLTRPDVIIHTAAMTQVDQCQVEQEACLKANVHGVENIITAARNNGAHVIQISTDFIFDGKQELLDETAIPAPVNFYGECKLAGEKLIQESNIPWCIIRTVLVYGITQDMSRSNIVLWVKNNLEQGKSIKVVSDQWRTPTLAEDLAMGCYLAAIKKATGIYHVSGAQYMSVYEIAIRTAQFFKLDTSLITPTDSSQFIQPARRPLKTGFIVEKARNELGYKPHTFEEGLSILASQLK
ncbi:MAG: NAD(P)-dependent oxidoreductase [Marivirga sp.]|nr:NAD(P)-dependent oxidoreductase [Marivirga sp.]